MILGAFPAVMGHTSARRFFFLCRVHISMMRFGCLYKKRVCMASAECQSNLCKIDKKGVC